MNRGIPVKQFQETYNKKQSKKIPMLRKDCDYFTAKEIAVMLQTTVQHVSAMCRGGHFEHAFKIGGHSWRIGVKKGEKVV